MARGGKCDCIPDHTGFGWCGDCVQAHREQIWKRMSEKDRAYDRQFAPEQSSKLDKSLDEEGREYNTGCSCHINPPCSYCTDGPGNDEYKERNACTVICDVCGQVYDEGDIVENWEAALRCCATEEGVKK